jgi:uncharacterized protein (TIGR00730 family)
MVDSKKTITIFGTSKAGPGDEVFEIAEQIGTALARKGLAIANGGYGGTMLASAKGANQAGGKVIGVTCSAFRRSTANEYITSRIVTDSLEERLSRLIELGDAYIVLPGGTGTLLELAHVWELKNKRFAGADKPIIIAGRFWKTLLELIAGIDPDSTRYVNTAENTVQVMEILNRYF